MNEEGLTKASNHHIVTQFMTDFKEEFPQISRLVAILAGTPSSSSSIERHFSLIPGISNYKRNGLSDHQLHRILIGRSYNQLIQTIKNQ